MHLSHPIPHVKVMQTYICKQIQLFPLLLQCSTSSLTIYSWPKYEAMQNPYITMRKLRKSENNLLVISVMCRLCPPATTQSGSHLISNTSAGLGEQFAVWIYVCVTLSPSTLSRSLFVQSKNPRKITCLALQSDVCYIFPFP